MHSPPFSAPPAAFISASLEIAHSLPPPEHTLIRRDTTLLPSCNTHCIPASNLVSSQQLHREKRYAIVHAIEYYDPAAIIQAEPCALHLLAVPLLLEHTDPHSTVRTAAPFSAPPTCTPPASSDSRTPHFRSCLCAPSYPPASSSETDIKQHAHARMTTCAPHARTTAKHHTQAIPHGQARIPARAARASNPGREKGGLPSRENAPRAPVSLLFSPTEV
ncbi:hypothetical protein B0H13DRAFT_2391408 [Mycena leptocephala]|nr:hypothetical protein B0H13DRAFT_2391408 [Mycena leptocephala]